MKNLFKIHGTLKSVSLDEGKKGEREFGSVEKKHRVVNVL